MLRPKSESFRLLMTRPPGRRVLAAALFLPPISLCVLNQPTGTRLVDPALRKDPFDVRDFLPGKIIRPGDFRIEGLAIAVLRLHQLLDLRALFEIESVRRPGNQETLSIDSHACPFHEGL